jgi:hypothetical protein
MTIQYDPSALGILRLDGKGGYRTGKSSGRYSFNRTTGAFAFTSGGLQGWPALFEVERGVPTLRLARSKKEGVGKRTRTGEHVCRCKDVTMPDVSGTPSGTRDPGERPSGAKNGAFRGTLTFRESWGSNMIVDVDLATGKAVSRFEGSEAHRSGGETVFVNKRGALVIASSKGSAETLVPTRPRDKEPKQPTLSPDGRSVAYQVAPVYYDSRVIVVTRDGEQLAELKQMMDPAWTPDGRLVVCSMLGVEGAKAGLYVTDDSFKSLKRIDPNLDDVRQPAVSPDGKRVAFVSHGHIWTLNLDGTGLKQVTTSADGEERPTWSPDGTALAVARRVFGSVQLVSLKDGKLTDLQNGNGRGMQSSGRLTWR